MPAFILTMPETIGVSHLRQRAYVSSFVCNSYSAGIGGPSLIFIVVFRSSCPSSSATLLIDLLSSCWYGARR